MLHSSCSVRCDAGDYLIWNLNWSNGGVPGTVARMWRILVCCGLSFVLDLVVMQAFWSVGDHEIAVVSLIRYCELYRFLELLIERSVVELGDLASLGGLD